MSPLPAKTIMTAPVITVTPQTPVREAARLLVERHISGLPVVDENGCLVGIVTEADFLYKEATPKPSEPLLRWFGRSLWLERLTGAARKAEGRTVGEVMTHNVITAEEDTPVQVLAALMVRYGVNRIPIVRGRQVVGIVTRADVLKVFQRSDEILEREARQILDDFLAHGEEVGVSAEQGVLHLRGTVGSPGRRQALLRRLWTIDGVVAIEDHDLREALRETAMWE
ncbi:MAG: CBS domain-containing protein [Armatimonadota bacterium]|nr:CBS domain-containing protein [Armatimonadota bacterium]MDR7450513.1 CBS domain-containing protein [Armatimonadota bacterium]MDR7466354.1 CBS domain-containing protein [Armatimonadota bacterium]MDR7493075.1 CBS domain-containing protein [Armatimonadota bacterium]MDR7498168.1 CBS domain-containing protein [Armatimonadota bacterium]